MMGLYYKIDLTLCDRHAEIVRAHGLDVREIAAKAVLQEIETRQDGGEKNGDVTIR